MSAIKDAWDRIKTWLQKNAPEAQFNLGCSSDDLRSLQGTLDVKLTNDFCESFMIHNGSNQRCCFPYGMYLLSHEEIAREWDKVCNLYGAASQEEDENTPEDGAVKRLDWHVRWIPFASNDSGEYFFLDFAPGTLGANGQVVEFGHEEGPLRILGANLESFLVKYADALEAGTYGALDGDIFAVDQQAYREAEQQQRLTWTPRKPAARKKTKKMDQAKIEEAVTFLREFFGAMRQWQLDGTRRADEHTSDETNWEDSNRMNEKGYELYLKNQHLALAELRRIYDDSCECTKTFTLGVGFSGATFSKEVPVLEVSERGKKIYIVVERTGWGGRKDKLQYCLLNSEKGLRVSDQVKIFNTIENRFASFDMLL